MTDDETLLTNVLDRAVASHMAALKAERDALAERADALHKALRELIEANDEWEAPATTLETHHKAQARWAAAIADAKALATPSAPKGPQQTTTGKGTE